VWGEKGIDANSTSICLICAARCAMVDSIANKLDEGRRRRDDARPGASVVDVIVATIL